MIVKNLNGIEYFACSKCESHVEETDEVCDVCGHSLLNSESVHHFIMDNRKKKIALTLIQLLKQYSDGKTNINHIEFIDFLKNSYLTKIESNELEVNQIIDFINYRFGKDAMIPKGYIKDGNIRSYIGSDLSISEFDKLLEMINNE